jgi:glutaredoxin-like protein NrdH
MAACDYTVVDISADADARDYVMSLGHLQPPVVVAGGQHWAGYRPDRIEQLGGWRA